jgi:ATP-dependent DNA helicase RecQ
MTSQSTERGQALELLRRALDNPRIDFREGQWEAIEALVNRRERLLVIERTGWGKSAVYFIATRILRDRGQGPTLIVSPLLALMRNQVEAAGRLGIHALTINSTNRDDWPDLRRDILADRADALLISPERLANEEFVETVLLPVAERLGLLVVDEVHCISDWGHDFRPDYRRLVNVVKRMPRNMPILGTTATANDRVVADVQDQLGNVGVQRGSLTRETLALQNLRLPDQSARLAWLAEHVPELPGTGIVYTLTKRDADQVADWLSRNGVTSRAYYSGVVAEDFQDSNSYREHLEGMLLRNEIKALVATTALGMGYDKPDLGFVVHYQAPGSVISYYQQVGRAGRAIDRAVGVLLSGREDGDVHEYFRSTAFPLEKDVQAILEALADQDDLTAARLEQVVNLRKGKIEQALKFLSLDSPAPVIWDQGRWRRTAVPYSMDHDRIARLTQQREIEWQQLQRYIDTPGCLLQFLAEALDDPHPRPCGRCARCLGHPIVDEEFAMALAIEAVRFLRHADLVLECKRQVAPGAFTQLGFHGRLPPELRAEPGRILSRWGDAGWGRYVVEDKRADHFRDELVDALAEMVRERWRPEPPPEWVTCVPSRHHPELVPSLARRLATRLELPYIAAVSKARDNEPQKRQENRYHRCRNLDGVFAVDQEIPGGPVLLVDDVVDSAWTLTVVAALLRRAGSGPVWPVALATSSVGD